MNLTLLTVAAFLDRLRSSEPTPGGGSAAALASAIGTSLLAMVAGMPTRRAESPAAVDQLHDAGRRTAALAERLTSLVDEDSRAYDDVVAAFRLPKATDAQKSERSARIQSTLAAAVQAPLAVARHSAEALEAATTVAEYGNRNAASDTGVGIELLGAGLRGAALNVEINLRSIKDDAYVQQARSELDALAHRAEAAASRARRQLGDG
ncbi:MAG: cyclodeaminase/cyclohydrolase family protein [Vicinamibacterales bacterium]